MTTTKAELHSVLVDLRESYLAKVRAWEQAATLDVPGIGYTNHQADDATAVYDQTVDASTIRAIQVRLYEVEQALARVQAGTYGICEHCGREIDIARLEAIPYTPLCLRCAETRDFRAGM